MISSPSGCFYYFGPIQVTILVTLCCVFGIPLGIFYNFLFYSLFTFVFKKHFGIEFASMSEIGFLLTERRANINITMYLVID
jgi:hypothetical protein